MIQNFEKKKSLNFLENVPKLRVNLESSDIYYELHKPNSDNSNQNVQTIVLIHGLASSYKTFLQLLQDFKKQNFQILIYDQRGHGVSKDADYDYTLESMAKDLSNILEAIQVTQAHILGHSCGGRVAMKFAELYSDKVQSLAIEDMDFCYRDFPEKQEFESLDQLIQQADKYKKEIPLKYSDEQELRTIMEKFYPKNLIEDFIKTRVGKNLDGSLGLWFRPNVRLLFQFFCANSDFTEFLSNTAISVLIIIADPQHTVCSKIGLQQLEEMENVKIKKIDGAHHNVHGTKKEEFLSILFEYLNEQK